MGDLPSLPRGEELTTHGRFLRALARSLVAPADQEDLVQEAWTRALEHPPRHESALKAWLARILRRSASSSGAREAEREQREATAFHARPERASDDPAEIAAELELSRHVLECVERLREPYKSTLYLRYYRGLAPERMAAESGVPVKTVKTRLARGLEELRDELDRRHGGERQAWVALLLPLTRSVPLEPLETLPPARVGPGALALGGALLVAASAAAVLFVLDLGTPERPDVRAPAPVAPLASPQPPASEVGTSPPARVALVDGASAALPRDTRIRLRGRVLDELGAPLGGVELTLAPLEREFRAPHWPRPDEAPAEAELTGSSDLTGRFEFVLTEPGPIRLALERDGFAPLGRRMLVFAGQELDLGNLVLEPGLVLSGRVRDADGRALAGVELWQWRRDEGLSFGTPERWVRAATSDAAGAFALARVAAGEWRLEARADEYQPVEASGTRELAEAASEPLELVLAPGAVLAGTVVGLTPEETTLARIVAVGAERGARAVQPAPDGSFRLAGLASDAELELELELGRPGEHEQQRLSGRVQARAGDEHVVLVAEREPARGMRPRAEEFARSREPSGALTVLVRGADGEPRPGALVLAAPAGRARGLPEVRAADREGRAFFDLLPAGEHELRVVSGVFEPRLESAAGGVVVSVVTGETTHTELQALLLGRLEGAVRVQGTPLAGAEVRVRPIGNDDARRGPLPSLCARSDGAGRFLFADLPLGAYTLELAHRTLTLPVTRTLELAAGRNELALELAPMQLAGRVQDELGRPLVGVRVLSLVRGAFEFAQTRTALATSDEQGVFVLTGLELSETTAFELEAEGWATLSVSSTELLAQHEFRLVPEVALTVELASAHAPFRVLLATGPAGERRTFGLRAGTKTRLTGLAPGTWNFTCAAPGRARRGAEDVLERTLELVAGQALELTLE